MSYINNNLMNDEKVIYKAKIHWFIFAPSIIAFFVGCYLFSLDQEQGAGPAFGMLVIMYAIYSAIKAVIYKKTTELGVTTKRVIAKVGLIRRNTIELNHSKVESFNINQSILGRIFNFGTLAVNGTGGGKTPIANIDSPLEFRKQSMEVMDSSQ